MGREATITYEQVAAAADAVKVAGGKPTSRGIRERLGNTGSMGTEQQAAVLGAKLEGTNERTGKAEAAAQARKHGEAVFAEAARSRRRKTPFLILPASSRRCRRRSKGKLENWMLPGRGRQQLAEKRPSCVASRQPSPGGREKKVGAAPQYEQKADDVECKSVLIPHPVDQKGGVTRPIKPFLCSSFGLSGAEQISQGRQQKELLRE